MTMLGWMSQRIAGELSVSTRQVEATAALLDDGATVPFIARYRKERTGSLDEVAIGSIRERLEQLRQLDDRRESILSSLAERDLLTDELKADIENAETLAQLEDLYLPYRPKRRTRATMARERGLEPLADLLLAQPPGVDPVRAAAAYVDPEADVEDADAALAGARDIIAETINESAPARGEIRELFVARSTIRSQVVEAKREEGATYRDYFDWSEPITKAPAHRIHALLRGERECVLRLSVRPEEEAAVARLQRRFTKGEGGCADQVRAAVEDGYKRLMAPSIENELRAQLKEKADEEACRVFASNLKDLLMAAPLGQKRVLAIDPGYRTGCKTVVLDAQGKLLTHTVLHIAGSDQERQRSKQSIADLVRNYAVEAVAVGNGTASREAEALVRSAGLADDIPIVLVNESGASIYSASNVARRELPDEDVTVRGAVSIGRRLMDPLAELVKIDPQSIGVGQYQHDVDPTRLRGALDRVVESCVNAVGVEANTASPSLLAHVSGLGPKLAESLVAHREEHGPFKNRKDLMKVPRLGRKAFEQAAGFLRIRGSDDPLDASAVHPESYPVVRHMASDLGCSVADLMRDEELRGRIDLNSYVTETVGRPTLNDILSELAKPGRDPREQFEAFAFDDGVQTIEDLETGMELPGIVTNVVDFGAFVDIGVHQDGLVHISQLADKYVEHPSSIVRVGQHVTVTVLDVDVERKRIGLSMKRGATASKGKAKAKEDPRG